jgi:hypothetical protein
MTGDSLAGSICCENLYLWLGTRLSPPGLLESGPFSFREVVRSAIAAIVGPIFANAIILPIRGSELTTRKEANRYARHLKDVWSGRYEMLSWWSIANAKLTRES